MRDSGVYMELANFIANVGPVSFLDDVGLGGRNIAIRTNDGNSTESSTSSIIRTRSIRFTNRTNPGSSPYRMHMRLSELSS